MTDTYRPYRAELTTAQTAATRLHDLVARWDAQAVPTDVRSQLIRATNHLGDAAFYLEGALGEHEALEAVRRESAAEKRAEHAIDARLDQEMP